MGLLIFDTDFEKGKYKISQNAFTDIDSYIDKYEERYLQELMGIELFKLFKADVDTGTHKPVTAKYLSIYNPIAEDDQVFNADFYYFYSYCSPCGHIRKSDGLVEMLQGFIYFEYLRDQKVKQTPSGAVVGQSENSRTTSFEESNPYSRYNEAVGSYHTIQWFIFKNKQIDYPLFNGQRKQLASWL